MLNKNFTRKDLSNKIYHKLGFSKNISSTIIDDFFELMILELIKSKNIKISSFGTFRIVKKNERIGRNPKTKVEFKILARKIVSYKPSILLKEKLNRL